MKKVLAIALAFALVLSLGMSAVAAKWTDEQFKDWADVGANYKADVQRLAVHDQGLNVFQGDTGSNFNPQKTFTRAELVAIVALVDKGGYEAGKTLNEMFATDAQRGEKFSDVSKDDWYFAVVNYAAFNGYTEGDGTGKFNPDGIVTSDMLYSYVLSLLGFQKEDMNGADWVGKVNSLIRTYGLGFNKAINYNVTREEVATVLSKAVDTAKYFKDRGNNTYNKVMDGSNEVKLLSNFDGAGKKEAGSIEIEGKVIKTKYAHLEGADIYPDNNVVLWVPGDNKNGGSGTIWQIDDPSDDFVPTQYLGRYVKVDVVRTGTSGGSHYRQAVGSKATPSYNNDVAALDYNTTTNTFKNAFISATEKAVTGNSWYNWTAGRAQPTRGAYQNFSGSRINLTTTGGDATDYRNWQLVNTIADVGNVWDYAYAIRDINIGAYTEVFYMNYIALRVGDTLRNGKTKLNYLDSDDCTYAEQKLGDIEFGDTAKKGDIVIGIVKAQDDGSNGLMTLEVIASKDGMRHLGTDSADIDGARYERSEVWGGVISTDFNKLDKNKTYGFFVANPVYAVAFDVDTYGVYGTFWATQFDKTIEVSALNYHSDAHFEIEFIGNNVVASGNPDGTSIYYLLTSSNNLTGLENTTALANGTYNLKGGEFCNGGTLKSSTTARGTPDVWGTDANGVNVAANNGDYVIAIARNNVTGLIVDAVASEAISRATTAVVWTEPTLAIAAAGNGASVGDLLVSFPTGVAPATYAGCGYTIGTGANANKVVIPKASISTFGNKVINLTNAPAYHGAPTSYTMNYSFFAHIAVVAKGSLVISTLSGLVPGAPTTGVLTQDDGTAVTAAVSTWTATNATTLTMATGGDNTSLDCVAVFTNGGNTFVVTFTTGS